MRPKLLQPTRQRPHERRERRRRQARVQRARLDPSLSSAPTAAAAYDPAVARAREAGGPIDNAYYSCGCGYVFRAPVSTTVSCPHCGAGQAW